MNKQILLICQHIHLPQHYYVCNLIVAMQFQLCLKRLGDYLVSKIENLNNYYFQFRHKCRDVAMQRLYTEKPNKEIDPES